MLLDLLTRTLAASLPNKALLHGLLGSPLFSLLQHHPCQLKCKNILRGEVDGQHCYSIVRLTIWTCPQVRLCGPGDLIAPNATNSTERRAWFLLGLRWVFTLQAESSCRAYPMTISRQGVQVCKTIEVLTFSEDSEPTTGRMREPVDF